MEKIMYVITVLILTYTIYIRVSNCIICQLIFFNILSTITKYEMIL